MLRYASNKINIGLLISTVQICTSLCAFAFKTLTSEHEIGVICANMGTDLLYSSEFVQETTAL